jgi:AhpD family alkylhydroperoxidase
MRPRLDFGRLAAEHLQPLYALQTQVDGSGLGSDLLNLVKLRASQMNGCAYCIDMHSKDARAEGESGQRLFGLDAWRETPYYNARERAALAWTEAVTRISEGHVIDEVYRAARAEFSEDELASLTLAVVAINAWNRLMISFRVPPGSYKPPVRAERSASEGR